MDHDSEQKTRPELDLEGVADPGNEPVGFPEDCTAGVAGVRVAEV